MLCSCFVTSLAHDNFNLSLTRHPRVKWVNLGEVKKKEYSSFQIQECENTTLMTTLEAYCERSFNLLDATNAVI